MAGNARKKKKNKTEITWKELRRQKVLIFWAAVFVIYGFIFCYLPLGGWLMAFQNYKPKDGILHSKFIGLAKFQQLFSDATFLRVIRNTLAMGVINLVLTFVMAIAFAILLNEVKSKTGKKTVQTISYLPHFLSWIIVTGILHDALSGTGIVNELLLKFHILEQPLNFFAYPKYFWWIVAFANVWKETGWNAIIYLSAITAIDPSHRRRGTLGQNPAHYLPRNQAHHHDTSSDECGQRAECGLRSTVSVRQRPCAERFPDH